MSAPRLLLAIEWEDSVGANHSKGSASGREHRCRSMKRGVWWRVGPLQQRPPEQRHRLHHPEGHAGGAAARDSRGARPKVGGGTEATADSSSAGRLTCKDSHVERHAANDWCRVISTRHRGAKLSVWWPHRDLSKCY